ncbi:MAG: BrnA antitoxin family protein [Proteobacteria bacterium]|nr:BrnA antitoxin family protein [Pseudomonadota bacterium]
MADDDAPELMPEDFARAKYRVHMQDVSREQWAAAVREKLGKQRVSIMLDASVIAFFKAKAGERGYQTLINQALRDAMRGEEMEATLRRVIREELSHV